jgi:hypothetical protein
LFTDVFKDVKRGGTEENHKYPQDKNSPGLDSNPDRKQV